MLEDLETRLTAICARAALRRKAFATATELISALASCRTSSSTVLSVILISSGVRTCFASGIVFNGISLSSGRGGSMAAIVASRCFCLSAATSCHVAPDAMVTVGIAAIVTSRVSWIEGGWLERTT